MALSRGKSCFFRVLIFCIKSAPFLLCTKTTDVPKSLSSSLGIYFLSAHKSPMVMSVALGKPLKGHSRQPLNDACFPDILCTSGKAMARLYPYRYNPPKSSCHKFCAGSRAGLPSDMGLHKQARACQSSRLHEQRYKIHRNGSEDIC